VKCFSRSFLTRYSARTKPREARANGGAGKLQQAVEERQIENRGRRRLIAQDRVRVAAIELRLTQTIGKVGFPAYGAVVPGPSSAAAEVLLLDQPQPAQAEQLDEDLCQAGNASGSGWVTWYTPTWPFSIRRQAVCAK